MYNQKPILGQQINWGHPLAEGLVGCWLFNEQGGTTISNLAQTGPIETVVKGASSVWDDDGIYFTGNGAGAEPDGIPVFDTEKGSIILAYTRKAATATYACVLNIENSNNNLPDEVVGWERTQKYIPNDDQSGVHYWDFGIEGVASPANTKVILAVTWGRVAGILLGYRDGISYGSRVGSGAWDAAAWDGTERISIGGRATSHPNNDYSCRGIIHWFYIYDRPLTPLEISQVSNDPHCMFEARKIWSVAVGAYTLACDGGSYALTGITTPVKRDGKIVPDAGSMALSGVAAGVLKGSALDADAGSMSLSGVAVTPLRDSKIVPDPGSYAITGKTIAALRGSKIVPDAGSYALTGKDIAMLKGFGLAAEAGVYSLTGFDVSFEYVPGAGVYRPVFRPRRR